MNDKEKEEIDQLVTIIWAVTDAVMEAPISVTGTARKLWNECRARCFELGVTDEQLAVMDSFYDWHVTAYGKKPCKRYRPTQMLEAFETYEREDAHETD